jgi:hypothetical protein
MLTASSFISTLNRRLCSSRSLPPTTLPTSRRGPAKRKISTCSPPQSVSDDSTTSKVSYARHEPMETIERFERYAAGGYYPIRIGDQFCSSRYYIVHKLGHGASSTIWLARDENLAKYVAIKFAVSELDRPFESAILRILQDGKSLLIPDIG